MDDVTSLQSLVHSINQAWRTGRFELLEACFDERVVFSAPDAGVRVQGRAAAIESYREFVTSATVHAYEQSDPEIDVFDDTGIASYTYTIEYEREGSRSRENGRDLFVFARDSGRWRAVWRTISFMPAGEDSLRHT